METFRSSQGGSLDKSRTAVVVSLGLGQTFAWGSTYYLPAILARPMAAEYGLPPSAVYAMFSAALLLSAFMGPAVGRRIDHAGGRAMLAASSAILGLGLGLLAVSWSAASLACAWLAIGVGMAMGLYEAAFAALTAAYGSDARSPITGITLIAGFASTVAWPLTGLLEAAVGWRGACLTWALIQVAVCVPLYLLTIPPVRPHAVLPANDSTPTRAVPRAAEWRTMALLAFVFAATWFNSTAMAAHLPSLLQLMGASAVAAIAAASLVGPAQVAARFFEYTFMRRFHPSISARFAALAHPMAACMLLVAGSPAAAVFTLLHGAGNGVMTIAKGTLPLALFGPQGYGLRQGWLTAPSRFAQAGAPFAFGLAMDSMGAGALLITTALALAAYAALLGLGRPAKPTG
jgi:predicted MFS family arabinose efflux permease